LFFTLFYVYVVMVVDHTLFEFQSLLLLKQFVPDLILMGQDAGEHVNLLPLVGLGPADLETSLLNVLLMVPFGLGLPLLTTLRLRHVIAAGALFSIAIELLQLTTGLLAGITFRIADVNDVIFNTIGVAVGCALFVGLVRIARRLSSGRAPSANPIVRFVAEQPEPDRRR
jgi:glycopeptide antibiotics resistance protein